MEQIKRCVALSICVIIIKESWGDVELHVGGADQQVRCAEYLHHHHKGVKRFPVSKLLPAQLSKPDWLLGGGAGKSGDLTCGHYMEEMDKHVLKIGIGI